MTESSQGGQGASGESREPFVSQGDRPEVQLDIDTPLSELRLRDLRDILWGGMGGKSPFTDKSFTADKSPFTEPPPKHFILEAPPKPFNEKWHKDKPEKIEFEPPIPVDRGFPPGPDPRLDQVIQAVSGMNDQVSQLADQVAEMQRRLQG